MTSGFTLFPKLTSIAEENTKPIHRIMGISVLLIFVLFFTYIAAMVAMLIGKLGFGINDSELIKRMLSAPGHSAVNINLLRWTNLLQSFTALGIPAILVTYVVGWNLKSVGNFSTLPPQRNIFWGLIIALSLTPLVAVINAASDWIFHRILPFSVIQTFQSLNANRQQIIEATLDMETLGELGVCILILALMPAVLEEYLFRGLITKFASNHFSKSITVGLFQALVFSFIHFSPFEFFGIFIAGVILGSIRMNTQSLWTSIWVHFLFNATAICLHYYTLSHFNSTGIFNDTSNWFTNNSMVSIAALSISVPIIILSIKKLSTPSSIH